MEVDFWRNAGGTFAYYIYERASMGSAILFIGADYDMPVLYEERLEPGGRMY